PISFNNANIDSLLLAEDDAADVIPGITKTIDVLADDIAPSGTAITGIVDPATGNTLAIGGSNPNTVTLSSGTTVTLNNDNTLGVVVPGANNGVETFDYIISDSQQSSQATVTLTPIDTDNDGIADVNDVDDDNDGLLDTQERISGTRIDIIDPNPQPDADFNSSNTATGTIPNLAPLGTASLTFGYELNGGAQWGDGINIRSDSTYGDFINVQANSTSLAGGSTAVYSFDATQTIYDLSFRVGGLDNNDEVIIEARYQGEVIPISASNFSQVQGAGMTARPSGDGFFNNSDNGAAIDAESFLFSLDGPVDEIIITTAKNNADTAAITLQLFDISYSTDIDTDGDTVVNALDIDSDNDGITDNVEAQSTAGYIAPSGQSSAMLDVNNDGLDDNYDTRTLSGGEAAATVSEARLNPVDTDSDTTADVIDSDSDNDGTLDVAERGDAQTTTAQTGVISNATTDTDGDGLLNVFEGTNNNDGFDVNDQNIAGDNGGSDGDYTNFALADSDGDTNANEAAANRTTNDASTGIASNLDFRDLPEWSVAGSTSIVEGAAASFNIALAGTFSSGVSTSVTVNLTDSTTGAADLGAAGANEAEFFAAITSAVAGRSDLTFNDTTGVLTYTAPADGATMAPLAVSIAATDDALAEGNETFNVALSAPTSSTVSTANDDVTTTITDNDTATLSIANVATNENDGSVTVTVTLDNAVQGGFSVDVNSADGTATLADGDYTAVSGETLTFAGTAGETQTFTFTPTGDTKLEADETVTFALSGLTGTVANIDISDTGTATIVNDDAAALTIADVSGGENGGPITVTVALDNAVQGGFVVDANTTDGTATTGDSDYTAIAGQTLTFAGTSGETQTFTITPTGDTTVEPDETLTV
ncbi:MAG: Calx-beta domain-containing protein, partial [Pseudomonadota bacterium]